MKEARIWDYLADYLERSPARRRLRSLVRVSDLVTIPLGWLYLFIKRRNRNKMRETRISTYDNSYAVAGRIAFMYMALVLMGILLLALIYAIVTGGLQAG